MAAVSYPVYWLLTLWVSPKIAVLPAIFAAILAYAAAGILTKVITKDDVVHLPKGEKIVRLLRLK
jgi:stage V sporulation protein B